MKVREVLMLKKHDLNDGCERLNGCQFNSVPLDQIRPSNRMMGRCREQVTSDGIPAVADPDDVPGIEQPPQVGMEPMRLAPIATPPRWDIDRIEPQVARLPRHHQVSRR
jgi:hypothetical protein